jgi:hypothetical protein
MPDYMAQNPRRRPSSVTKPLTDDILGLGAVCGLSPSSALKMETARFSETLAFTNQSTRRLSPEEHNHYRHRRENLKSDKNSLVFY